MARVEQAQPDIRGAHCPAGPVTQRLQPTDPNTELLALQGQVAQLQDEVATLREQLADAEIDLMEANAADHQDRLDAEWLRVLNELFPGVLVGGWEVNRVRTEVLAALREFGRAMELRDVEAMRRQLPDAKLWALIEIAQGLQDELWSIQDVRETYESIGDEWRPQYALTRVVREGGQAVRVVDAVTFDKSDPRISASRDRRREADRRAEQRMQDLLGVTFDNDDG